MAVWLAGAVSCRSIDRERYCTESERGQGMMLMRCALRERFRLTIYSKPMLSVCLSSLRPRGVARISRRNLPGRLPRDGQELVVPTPHWDDRHGHIAQS